MAVIVCDGDIAAVGIDDFFDQAEAKSAAASLSGLRGCAALPFSLTQTGAINTNKFTASSNGTLGLYLDEKAVKGFYYVSFRVPGANTGTP